MTKFTKLLSVLLIFSSASLLGQSFIQPIENSSMSLILNQECIVELASGEKITGVLKGASIMNGYMSSFSIKTPDGEKTKYKAVAVNGLSVKAGKLAKMTVASESATSITKMAKTDFNEIINREYFVFETALRDKKSDKPRLMQLLNPGFDSKIKVYVDPNAKESGGVGVGGMKVTGGGDKSFLFVQNGEKALVVKKKKYDELFEELYSGCPIMIEEFKGDKIKWQDVAGHVFAYDQACK